MGRYLHSASLGFAVLVLVACGSAPAPPPPQPPSSLAPNEQLSRLVEHYWDEYLLLNPRTLPDRANRGREGVFAYHLSAQALADSLALERRSLVALLELPRASLDAGSQVTYDIFKRERELAVEGFTYPAELVPVNPFSSMPLLFAQAAAGESPILSAKDYQDWQARTDDYVRWTQEAIANMRAGLRRGYSLPRVLVEEMLPILAALAADAPANAFYQPLRSIAASAVDAERKGLSDTLSARIRADILPAYRALHDFLRNEYLPRARTSVGLSELPLGESWYGYLIKSHTGAAQTPAEIHAIGMTEVERLRGRLRGLTADTAFAGNAQGFLDTMRRNPRWSFQTPDELLQFYRELKGRSAAAMPALFAQQPQNDFEIRRVASFREATAPPLSYQRATPDGRNAAILYVNTAALSAAPLLAAPTRFLREALPGHHYQLSIQEERADLPRFRRYGGDPAFIEGWGLYAELRGEELGLYGDRETKFLSLLGELDCAAGLVIDTGLHAQGWTRQRAIDYLQAQLPLDEAGARAAVDRDLALPAEALACTLGARKIQGLRARAEQSLGARFDVRAFHAQILQGGAMPLDILESEIKRWLDGLR